MSSGSVRPLDADVLATAWTVVENAEAVIVVGTSAVVYPVAALPQAARARNVPLIEINVEDTPLTGSVTHVVRATAATALAGACESVVKRLAPGDRPREKLARAGATALGDNELIAVILGQGGAGRTALDLGAAVLACAGGPTGLSRVSLTDLQRLDGVGIARAAQILAAVELGRRTLSATLERRQFTKPRDVAAWLLPQFGGAPVEQFGTVLLDTKLRLIGVKVVSIGSLDASTAVPRDVFGKPSQREPPP
jgi:DNA repair protein RadC